MNEIDAQKGKFLMRRIEYTPDFVNVYCDINIKWLQEIYFKSIINMPIMLFKERAFNNFHIFSYFHRRLDYQKHLARLFLELCPRYI